ncbi:hypothetical protein [Calothrix sp. PCC 7507]|uniref:hypothetical protein n=1 Tax=Calothrix sp. PCC 7507 TaxID=99598 RepID=UPI0002E4B503|nr:hypothetical protein [Calothrix sp. PCC 7507]
MHNDFLEQQARYQQETPEQRQAEKAWEAIAIAHLLNLIKALITYPPTKPLNQQ